MAPSDDEIRGARFATISALIVIAGFVASKAARDAILLSSFDVTYLPLFIGLSAVISFPIIVVAGRLMTRFGPARLMPVLNALSAAFAIAEWVLLSRYPRPTAVAVFFHLSTSGAVLVSGFWSIVNERFDVQSAKRHIGRIGMGATLGGILGGLIAERTAVYLSPDKILLVLAVMQGTSALALYMFGRHTGREPVAAVDEGSWLAVRLVAKSRLLRNVGAIVVLGAIGGGILDYVFKADIVASASKQDLLRSLSIFYMITAVITAVIQVAVTTPLVARLGVPRSVATLPITVTAFGAIAVAIPGALSAVIARGAELVTRNSVYRAGYELLYAPMAEEHKRPTKVILDVGGDRIGDLLGAQLVGALVVGLAEPRAGLLIAAVVVGALSVMFAIRLPRSYTEALEESLLARAPEPEAAVPEAPAPQEPWATLTGMPTVDSRAVAPPRSSAADPVAATVADLRSGDPARIKAALARPLTPELAAHVIALVGRDDVAREALVALQAVAPGCTGMLVDALLDLQRDVAIRRRLPAVLLAGEPGLAAWGLWRGLGDPSFDVRYRCGAVLSRLAADGHLGQVSPDDVFETVKREFLFDQNARSAQLTQDPVYATEDDGDGAAPHPATGLEHVFTVLGLVLPAEPLRIALHAVQTDDPTLRGTALEYLESILPADVRAQLWPLLAGEGDAVAAVDAIADAAVAAPDATVAAKPPALAHTPRSPDELLAELNRLYATAAPASRARTERHTG